MVAQNGHDAHCAVVACLYAIRSANTAGGRDIDAHGCSRACSYVRAGDSEGQGRSLLLVGSALDGHDEGHEAPIAISDAGATAWAKPLLEASQPLIDEFPAISSSP